MTAWLPRYVPPTREKLRRKNSQTARIPGKWLVHCHIPHHTVNDNVKEKGGPGLMVALDVK